VRTFLLLALAAALPGAPARIVSTTPAATEILYALGLGDRVAGVTDFCRYPPEAARKPRIGGYTQPNLEAIAALRPDLVIIQKNPVRLQARLQALGLNVLEIDHDSVDRLLASIAAVGRAAGAEEPARRLTARLRAELEEIRNRTANLPRRKLMFLVGRSANALEAMIAAGGGSYLNELMAIAGGENIFRDAPAAYPRISLEEILARDPDVIVDMGEMADTVGVTEEQKRRVVRLWQRYPSLRAVAAGRVHAVAADVFVVPGPRIVEAAREFARLLHPEARW
jgi:iron complex transport system substrate-binding protein